jgi:hypothetical protein
MATLREALVILPDSKNDKPIHATLKRELCNVFGGYTATPCQGGWVNPQGELIEDYGTAYSVAMLDSEANRAVFKEIANTIGKLAKQQAMYVRYANGEVEIFDVYGRPQAANDA